ncbi:MAG: hypothetical protein ACLR0V_08235 [Roseburia hominis]
MPERATKEEKLILYRTLGDVAIQNRIAASFFSGENSGSYSHLPMRRQGHRHSDLISKKFRSEKKKGDIL